MFRSGVPLVDLSVSTESIGWLTRVMCYGSLSQSLCIKVKKYFFLYCL